jgi:hypothetical protein
VPHTIEDGDAAYLLCRVGRIVPQLGIAYVVVPKVGLMPHEWVGWDGPMIVSLKLLARAPEPRDFAMPRQIEPAKAGT